MNLHNNVQLLKFPQNTLLKNKSAITSSSRGFCSHVRGCARNRLVDGNGDGHRWGNTFLNFHGNHDGKGAEKRKIVVVGWR